MQTDFLDGLYCGPAPVPSELWWRWNLDPVLLAALGLLALAVGRRPSGWLALATLAVAFVSPLCALSAALFSARVVHHVLLIAVAAPLLAIAWPARKPLPPALAFVGSTAILWAWHLPAAYDLALSNLAVYWVMQLSLLGSATVFWRTALDRGETRGRGLLLILAGYMQMALLGALLTFAPLPLYAIHAAAPLVWGFWPIADQQLGGLIMWVPAGVPFFAFGALLARREWRAMEGRPA
jgi:putative membrane protein